MKSFSIVTNHELCTTTKFRNEFLKFGCVIKKVQNKNNNNLMTHVEDIKYIIVYQVPNKARKTIHRISCRSLKVLVQ